MPIEIKGAQALQRFFRTTYSCTDAYNQARIRRLVRLSTSPYRLPIKNYSHKLVDMNTYPSEAPMATTRKPDKPNKKEVRSELTFLDVRQAARDGQKVFDQFVINGRLPVTK